MAKPKLALIPAAQGTKFYSVLPSDGTGDFTFTRGSVATRINAQGLIENVASGQSRLDYPMIDGVQKGCPHHILEPQSTNLFTYSEDFNQWTSGNSSIGSNKAISPDGSLNADELKEDSSNTSHFIRLSSAHSSVTEFTFSVFAKSLSNNRYMQLIVGNGISGSVFAKYDLENGVLINDTTLAGTGYETREASIESYGNNWYKCVMSGYKSNAAGSNLGLIALSNTTSAIETNTYQGDGASGVYIWGATIENLSYPTSYIPTSGESGGVTRSAETATGAGQSSTFNDSEGVLMAEISSLNEDTIIEAISISDGTGNNRVLLGKWNVLNQIKARVTSGGSQKFDVLINVPSVTNNNKLALKYKANDFSAWVNGFKLAIDTSGIVPVGLNRLEFNSNGSGSAKFIGNTKQLQYFDSALADTQLEQLTSWQSFRDMANGQLYTIE